jgi:NADH:ubiquinone oxidoreductase subunit F (NADH-binding)
MSGTTLCPLAEGAVAPIKSAMRIFRDDFVRVAQEGSPRPEPMMEAAVRA